jgi:hypothetical protein
MPVLLALILLPQLASAEVFQNIQYMDTLGILKTKYPHATFTQLHPGWATEEDVLYSITGVGMPGTTIVKFDDTRPDIRRYLADAVAQDDSSAVDMWTGMLSDYGDDSVEVSWVRWVPTEPIPLSRYVSKYGPLSAKQFREIDMMPYYEWPSKGVEVYLGDSENMVVSVEFTFTKQDRIDAYKARGMEVPSWLLRSVPKKPAAGATK